MVQRTLGIAAQDMPKDLDATDGLAGVVPPFPARHPKMQGIGGWKAFWLKTDRIINLQFLNRI